MRGVCDCILDMFMECAKAIVIILYVSRVVENARFVVAVALYVFAVCAPRFVMVARVVPHVCCGCSLNTNVTTCRRLGRLNEHDLNCGDVD